MSRGLGRIERRIIEVLAASAPLLTGAKIARLIAENNRPTPAISASVRRALGRLKAQNVILQLDRRWVLTSAHRRRQREEADRRARQRARQKANAESAAMTPPGVQDNARLAKLLGMLGSAHPGEVLAAARAIERERKKLGKTWQDILLGEDALRNLLSRRAGRRGWRR